MSNERKLTQSDAWRAHLVRLIAEGRLVRVENRTIKESLNVGEADEPAEESDDEPG